MAIIPTVRCRSTRKSLAFTPARLISCMWTAATTLVRACHRGLHCLCRLGAGLTTPVILVHVRDGGCNMPPRFVGQIGKVGYEASRHDFQVTTGAVKAQFAALS